MGQSTFKCLFLKGLFEHSQVYHTVLVFLLIPCSLTLDFRAPPIIPNIPFLWAWNAPTDKCLGKYSEPIDLKIFSLKGSPKKSLTGQGVTIFYTDRLGYYPHIDSSQTSKYGGIPQLGLLKDHLDKAKTDILYYMPMDNVGLAVIDWEDWRPTWERNWKPKDIYRNKSVELVQQQNAQLSLSEAIKLAKEEFEKAGRSFMEETLKLGKALRPNHFWGYYLFPDCYNHRIHDPNYSGFCPNIEKQRNDALDWLWNQSTALYPSIYLRSDLKSNPNAALYVRGRVQEAIRVSKVPDARNPLPIFVYTRLVFTDKIFEFLSQYDLVNTIGETVALGVSGMVIWGTTALARSMKTCLTLHDYMETTLNPYLINVTLASKMCSQALCEDQGVCTRKNWNSNEYLHLNPTNFAIQFQQNGKYEVRGKPTVDDLEYFSKKFRCNCYANLNCKERNDMDKVRAINVCAFEDVCINVLLYSDPSSEPDAWQASSLANTIQNTDHPISATVPPCVPRTYIGMCLLVLSIYLL
uniref:Hyaluronidase n=1 Tax=Jaculus jaculus TaxID=51337 RepID=A0A8C5KGA4_JACJA